MTPKRTIKAIMYRIQTSGIGGIYCTAIFTDTNIPPQILAANVKNMPPNSLFGIKKFIFLSIIINLISAIQIHKIIHIALNQYV